MAEQGRLAFRWANLGDLEDLRALFRSSSLSNERDRAFLAANPAVLEFSSENLAAGHCRVALEEGRVVGLATTLSVDGAAELEDLFVEPDRQRKGIGTALVADAVEIARRCGCRRLEVSVNPAALDFYQKNGFSALYQNGLSAKPGTRMLLDIPDLGQTTAAVQANDAAVRADVTVASLREIDDLEEIAGLFAETWGSGDPMSPHVLRAMTLAGNYVAGAVQVGVGLVGASAGLAAVVGEGVELHSHITATRPHLRGGGIGRALKLHQRAWALDRGIRIVSWTYDPLVRANAAFNLGSLGARPVAYLRNVYGNMRDEINRDDASDRFLLRWELDSPAVAEAAAGRKIGIDSAENRPVLLAVSPSGAPKMADDGHLEPGTRYRVEVPPDIAAVRRSAPDVAAEWRRVTRGIFGEVLGTGGRVEVDAAGCYVVEVPAR